MADKLTTIDALTGQGTERVTGPFGTEEGQPDDDHIVKQLQGFKNEAVAERTGGQNPREDKWKQNLDLYWNRHDFSGKAPWQAKETMPEVPVFVDSFAAALTEALVATQDNFYTIRDPGDRNGDLTPALKKMTDGWLSTCGRNQNGHPLGFTSVFEEQIKLGALMACCGVVTWKNDVKGGRVAVETVDPRNVWLDTTYRNLYRIRRVELDRHDLASMAKLKDSAGKPIFKLPELSALVTSLTLQEQGDQNQLSGGGAGMAASKSSRQPIVMDEYIATVLDSSGNVIKERGLYVVANDKYLIRGPEDNPFWHDRDWLLYAPLVNHPLSVYGRSYMEDFASVANTFTELTNMILDAVFVSSMKAYAMVPSMLMDPAQAMSGIHPNKVFLLEDGGSAKDFAQALDLGTLNGEALQMWQGLKNELKEASRMNEVGMGQFAPKGRTSAQEVRDVQQSSSGLIRSVASSLETRFLDPMLDLVWKTGLQHAKASDPYMNEMVGAELYGALISRRRELITRPIGFQSRGISGLIEKSRMMRSLLQILQIVGSNERLLAEFLKAADLGKLLKLMFELSDVPIERLELNEREKQIRAITEPMQAMGAGPPGQPGAPAKQGEAAGGSGPGSNAQREMASLTSDMGVS